LSKATTKKDWKAYWKFMLVKAFRTGLQSAIGVYLSAQTGIIDAELGQIVLISFVTAALTSLQAALEQYKPAVTYDQ
jgi:hypothetical protein